MPCLRLTTAEVAKSAASVAILHNSLRNLEVNDINTHSRNVFMKQLRFKRSRDCKASVLLVLNLTS